MRVLLVRHAEAVEAAAFLGSDLDRPLTPEGRKLAQTSLSRLARILPPPGLILTSEATRCRETASILSLSFGGVEIVVDEQLNPGAPPKAYRKALREHAQDHVAVVGHEPDLSQALGRWVAEGELAVKLRKGAVVSLDLDAAGRGCLRALVPPEWLAS